MSRMRHAWLLFVGTAVACAASPSISLHSASSTSNASCAPLDEYFPGIPVIEYKGPTSTDPLSFRYYNKHEVILGKPMHEWLRFSVAFWHTFRGDGSDPFGSATKRWPWEEATVDAMTLAKRRMEALFEMMHKLSLDLWCFHDRDIAPEGATLQESNANLDAIADLAAKLQEGTNIRPLWGTAQLFKHPRFMNGAATAPQAEVYAFAAAQVKKAMEVSKRLGASAYVFWGGREGYQSLLNTDMRRELAHMAQFLHDAHAYKVRLGFNGTLLLEPKPQEPTKHQYDWDVSTTAGFLERNGLSDQYKINVECNHATLAGHSCHHEVETARILGLLGNIDANTGDAQSGWDTDQFLTDPTIATLVMSVVIKQGGLAPGGINFDAKLRRESTDVKDLIVGHVGAMDALARGLRNAAGLQRDGALDSLVAKRYQSFDSTELGKAIEKGDASFEAMEAYALSHASPVAESAHEELAERLLSFHL